MMAASMKGKRKNTKARTTGAPPPRRSVRLLGKDFMWDRLRNTQDIMRHVYSFLSVYDRVHLAEVDKTFRDDEDRGRVVGVYGDEGLDILEAFEDIKEWHDYEISSTHQMDETIILYRGDDIQIKAEWYTPEGGWDLERIVYEYLVFCEPEEEDKAFQFYCGMNEERVHMIRMQEEMYQTYQMRPLRAPYNTLFELLEKHGLGRLARMFATAQNLELELKDENRMYIYAIIYHLLPGRTFFAGPGCKPILLKLCRVCRKTKEGTNPECCIWEECPGFDTCSSCTRSRTCPRCGRNVNCPAEHCPNDCNRFLCQCCMCPECDENEAAGMTCCGFMLMNLDDEDGDDDDGDDDGDEQEMQA